MAVHERRYRGYDGPRTPPWSRFLVIPRYALQDVFRTRQFLVLYVLAFVLPLMGAVVIYLKHNLNALTAMSLSVENILPIDERAFQGFLAAQCLGFGFLLTLAVAPGLISQDLRNNGLPLYLARPFHRAEYVLGKLAVLVLLLSSVSWVPGLLLFGLQASLAPAGWLAAHARIAPALLVGAWVYILVLSLLALALSAWVRLKPLASGLLVAVLFVGPGIAEFLSAQYDTPWGRLLDLTSLTLTVWAQLFGQYAGQARLPGLPPWGAWLGLAGIAAVSLFLLDRKVRAYEVVR